MPTSYRPPTEKDRRAEGPSYVYADRDSDPDQPTYPRGHDEDDTEVITRPCRVVRCTQENGILGPAQWTLVLEATDGTLSLPMEKCQEPRMTVKGLIFYNTPPVLGDTGYTLVFERPLRSAETVPYQYVRTIKPANA